MVKQIQPFPSSTSPAHQDALSQQEQQQQQQQQQQLSLVSALRSTSRSSSHANQRTAVPELTRNGLRNILQEALALLDDDEDLFLDSDLNDSSFSSSGRSSSKQHQGSARE